MLVNPQLGFTYDCRLCQSSVVGKAGIFAMQGNNYLCGCKCGGDVLSAAISSGTLCVEYPCAICREIHTAKIMVSEVLKKRLYSIPCAHTGLDSCIIGRPELIGNLDSAETSRSLRDLVRQLLDLPPAHDDEDLPVPGEVITSALAAVRELAYAGKIVCPCKSKNFKLAYYINLVRITCSTCGAYHEFPAATAQDVERISGSGLTILKNR